MTTDREIISIQQIPDITQISLTNEPFNIFGRMIIYYDGKKWSYSEQLYPEKDITDMCFPEEQYQNDEQRFIYLGAFEDTVCVGLIVLEHDGFKYLYVSDLKVKQSARHKNIGSRLIRKAYDTALALGYNGLYTIGQDNNQAACRFYLKNQFVIGGFDNHIYKGTPQEDKANIIFYLD